MYLEDSDQDRAEDGESVCTLETIPDEVCFGLSGPAASHEEVEEKVHQKEKNDDIEDLSGGKGTTVRERESLRLTM